MKNVGAVCLTPSKPGGVESAVFSPCSIFFHNSKTPYDIEKNLSDYNFTPLTVILHILSKTILIRCCHGNRLFLVCYIIFGMKNKES